MAQWWRGLAKEECALEVLVRKSQEGLNWSLELMTRTMRCRGATKPQARVCEVK